MIRRFPAPWTPEQIPGGWMVKDANGESICYLYVCNKEPFISDTRLRPDEARRIALGIARLPGLLGR